jgi:hypothetical protein
MDNVQKYNIRTNVPSSQNSRPWLIGMLPGCRTDDPTSIPDWVFPLSVQYELWSSWSSCIRYWAPFFLRSKRQDQGSSLPETFNVWNFPLATEPSIVLGVAEHVRINCSLHSCSLLQLLFFRQFESCGVVCPFTCFARKRPKSVGPRRRYERIGEGMMPQWGTGVAQSV